MTEETRLMLEIAKMRLLRKAKGKMLDRLQLRQSLLDELKELETCENLQDLQNMLQSEQCISKAKDFCDFLHEVENGNKEYNRLFSILDCLKLDNNYTLALHLANNNISFGDVSWFYCYEGDNDIYQDSYNHPNVENDEEFFQCMGNLSEYMIFEHLNVENTAMGAWQAFLLSIALSQLPTSQHGGYRRRKMIMGKEDLDNSLSLFRHIRLSSIDIEEDLTPWASIDGNNATVSCCFWNNWRGLYRETIKMELENCRVAFSHGRDIKVLYKYNCGIKF